MLRVHGLPLSRRRLLSLTRISRVHGLPLSQLSQHPCPTPQLQPVHTPASQPPPLPSPQPLLSPHPTLLSPHLQATVKQLHLRV